MSQQFTIYSGEFVNTEGHSSPSHIDHNHFLYTDDEIEIDASSDEDEVGEEFISKNINVTTKKRDFSFDFDNGEVCHTRFWYQ